MRFSFVTGVGINVRPRDSRVICLSVSCSFDRFLIYCLRDSMASKKRFLSLIFLRSFLLQFFAALLSLRFECVYLSANRFSMAWENGIQIPFQFHFHFSFFAFAWHWKTDLNFAFLFSFLPNFQKRIWTSFFVFRFRITLKNGFEFRFCMACYLKNRSEFRLLLLHDSWKTDYCTSHLKSPDTPSGFTGEFTFCAKESNWIFSSPGPKWVVNSPAPMICPPHTVLLFKKGWQI